MRVNMGRTRFLLFWGLGAALLPSSPKQLCFVSLATESCSVEAELHSP